MRMRRGYITWPWPKAIARDWVETVPEQIRFEVCSWLRNPTDANERRREALAGLGACLSWRWLTSCP